MTVGEVQCLAAWCGRRIADCPEAGQRVCWLSAGWMDERWCHMLFLRCGVKVEGVHIATPDESKVTCVAKATGVCPSIGYVDAHTSLEPSFGPRVRRAPRSHK